MLMYSMWREGIHYGWDRISPYDDRTPYLGYYTEGQTEVADWEIKWQKEHGIDYQVYPFPLADSDAPIKRAKRSEALEDGFLESEFDMDFAMLWSSVTTSNLKNVENFKTCHVPYWIEYYFKNPNYKTIDNKPIMYIYSTPNVVKTIGGTDKMIEALEYLEGEVKKLGFDGMIFCVDQIDDSLASAFKLAFGDDFWQYRYGWAAGAANNAASVIEGHNSVMKNENQLPFVMSVPMGFDTTPWREASGGFFTADDYKTVMNWVKTKSAELAAENYPAANNILLTCWNEYGEGHFYCPSTANGFEYLNEVRNTVTDCGYLDDEALPTERAIARMGVLYPTGRRLLKIRDEKKDNSVLANEQYEVVARWDFKNKADFDKWSIEKGIDMLEYDPQIGMKGKATGGDPTVYYPEFPESEYIDCSRIKAVRIKLKIENGSKVHVYYKTTDDSQMGVNGKRFETIIASNVTGEYLAFPIDSSKLTGKLTGIRIDPDDNTYSNFEVEYLEVLANDKTDFNVLQDGEKIKFNTEPVIENGNVLISVNRYFQEQGANTIWDNLSKTLNVTLKNNSFKIQAGNAVAIVNGQEKTLRKAPEIRNSNLFMNAFDVAELLGYEAYMDEVQNALIVTTSAAAEMAVYKQNAVAYAWEFNLDGYQEGWTRSNDTNDIRCIDGFLQVSSRGNDPVIHSPKLEVDASKYRYLVIRMINETESVSGNVYFTGSATESNFSGKARVDFEQYSDKKLHEYVIDMSAHPSWTGTITQIRVDPYDKAGMVYIDSIKLVESVNQ